MTPRTYVESLRRPLVEMRLGGHTRPNPARIEALDAALEAEALAPQWGAGGVAFFQRAKAAAEAGEFTRWLDSLPAVRQRSPADRGGGAG